MIIEPVFSIDSELADIIKVNGSDFYLDLMEG